MFKDVFDDIGRQFNKEINTIGSKIKEEMHIANKSATLESTRKSVKTKLQDAKKRRKER